MDKITSLPDLGRSMKILKISTELENVSPETFLGLCIHGALRDKKIILCIKTIQEAAHDNRKSVIDLLGEELLNDIESI